MRGFVVIVAAMAIFVAAFISMSVSAPQSQGASYKESFSGAKLMLTDIEIMATMAAQDCNWDATQRIIDIEDCIDGNSALIIQKAAGTYTTCTKTDASVTNTPNPQAFSFVLSCTTLVEDTKGTVFRNEFSKTISGKKYN